MGSGCKQSRFDVGDLEGATGVGDPSTGAGTGFEEGRGDAGEDGVRLDVQLPDGVTGSDGASCQVSHDPDGGLNAPGACEQSAPPDAFLPAIQWAHDAPNVGSWVTPLVANLTDDNGDGVVDLCDTPDILAVLFDEPTATATDNVTLHVFDGATGALHYAITDAGGVSDATTGSSATPAIGDVDNDGTPEIIAVMSYPNEGRFLSIFEHDGSLKLRSAERAGGFCNHIALADVDNDGDVEISCGSQLYDHMGSLIFDAARPGVSTGGFGIMTVGVLADLDGDEDMEIISGPMAFHHDGGIYYGASAVSPGQPAVADVDGDGLPEILHTTPEGIAVLEHDGRVKFSEQRPTGTSEGALIWDRPVAIHDFEGDGATDFAMASRNEYSVYSGDAVVKWTVDVEDLTGAAGSTAFDFLGDGRAEAVYADETTLFVFERDGTVLLEVDRTSETILDNPVVADVDNDGSAEIVIVGDAMPDNYLISTGRQPLPPSPAIRVIKEEQDRWIQARRIWNQHSYHVTNVREDGTIPQVEPHHWEHLNTFRTNAQIEAGTVCKPTPRPEG